MIGTIKAFISLIVNNYKTVLLLAITAVSFTAGWTARSIVAERDMLRMENKVQQEQIIQQEKAKAYQQQLQAIANQVEKQAYDIQKKHDKELAYYRTLADLSGGLFDNITSKADNPTAGSSSFNQATPGRYRLSEEATGFLLQQANQADRVVDQYLQCQRYVNSISGVTP